MLVGLLNRLSRTNRVAVSDGSLGREPQEPVGETTELAA